MKVTDRAFNCRGGVGGSYKPTWYLYLECGHVKTLNPTSHGYYRGELVKHVRCTICDGPPKAKPKIGSSDALERFADYIIANDL